MMVTVITSDDGCCHYFHRGTFVKIVGGFFMLANHTQGQLLLLSNLIMTGVVPGYN